jgi:hypothetical protein
MTSSISFHIHIHAPTRVLYEIGKLQIQSPCYNRFLDHRDYRHSKFGVSSSTKNFVENGPLAKPFAGHGGFPSAPKGWNAFVKARNASSKVLVLSEKRSKTREVFKLELSLSANLTELAWGVWEAEKMLDHHELARLASTRAQIKVLAGTWRNT